MVAVAVSSLRWEATPPRLLAMETHGASDLAPAPGVTAVFDDAIAHFGMSSKCSRRMYLVAFSVPQA